MGPHYDLQTVNAVQCSVNHSPMKYHKIRLYYTSYQK